MTRTSVIALAVLVILAAVPLSFAQTPGSAMKDMLGMAMQADRSAPLVCAMA